MKEKNYIHKNDVFIETTASFISWLSFDLVKFLKDNEDDHELLIKKMHLVEDRKSLLRRLNSYIVDMDIQTDISFVSYAPHSLSNVVDLKAPMEAIVD